MAKGYVNECLPNVVERSKLWVARCRMRIGRLLDCVNNFVETHQSVNTAETRTFRFADLSGTDLYVDAVYEGGRKGNAGDDPLNALLNVSNQGGVRYRGSLEKLHL